MKIVVYHGGTDVVEHPLCKVGRANLDFGQGFYVTDIRDQAITWAHRMADRRELPPILNRYILDRGTILAEARCRILKCYDQEWLEFIMSSRQGVDVGKSYDYVEGGVANDRIIDTVNLYIAGLVDLNMALQRLAAHQPNNQMCLLNQLITDKFLIFDGTEKI